MAHFGLCSEKVNEQILNKILSFCSSLSIAAVIYCWLFSTVDSEEQTSSWSFSIAVATTVGVGGRWWAYLDDECHSFCPSVRLHIILSKYADLRVNFCMTLLVVCSASCLLLLVASGKTWHTGVTSQKWCIWSKEVNTDLEIRLKGGLKTLALRVSTNSSFISHKVLLFIFYVIVNHESFYIETYMNFDCCHLF